MDQDAFLRAFELARQKTLDSLRRHRVTYSRVGKRLSEALDAMEVKATYDKETGQWAYSNPLIAHGPRLKAIEIAAALLEMKPSERQEVTLYGEISHLLAEIDGATLGPPSLRKPINEPAGAEGRPAAKKGGKP